MIISSISLAPSWGQYAGADISPLAVKGGVSAGQSIYVGQTPSNTLGRVIPSGGTFCFANGPGNCSTTFNVLLNLPGQSFSWVSSSSAASVPNSVLFGSFGIGRVKVNNEDYIGTIMFPLGLMYYNDKLGTYDTAVNFEALTCNALVGPTTTAPITTTTTRAPTTTLGTTTTLGLTTTQIATTTVPLKCSKFY
jgi:hypothetical protein